MLGAFERALPWSVVKLDAIVRGFLGTNALSRFSRAPAPVMQNAATAVAADYITRAPGVSSPSIEIQGESLRTWSYKNPQVEKVMVVLTTIGRPLEAGVEVWNGAGNTPVTPLRATNSFQLRKRAPMKAERRWGTEVSVGVAVTENVEIVEGTSPRATEQLWITIFCHPSLREQIQVRAYSEDGELRPFSAVLETPRGPSTVAIRNIGQVATAGRDWRGAEGICCVRPRDKSGGVRCGPCSGADGISADCERGSPERGAAVRGPLEPGPEHPGRVAAHVHQAPGETQMYGESVNRRSQIENARMVATFFMMREQPWLGAGSPWARLSRTSRFSSRPTAGR